MSDMSQRIVSALRAKKDAIAKLPPEKQAQLYSFSFDQYVAPKMQRLNLTPEETDQLKIKWVENIIGRKMGGPLEFEAPKEKLPFFSFSRGVAKLKAVGAAGAGSTATALDAIHNLLDIAKGSPTAPTGLETKVKGFLRAVEAKNWEEAQRYLSEDELYAFGGLGKLLVSYLGGKYAGAGAKLLGATTDWPVVSSLAMKTLSKAATGAAVTGGATAAFTSDPETLTKWIVGGAALDALVLPVLGKGIKRTLGGVSNAYERVRAWLPKGQPTAPAASPVAAPVGESPVVSGIFEQVMKERYPDEHAAFKKGARLDQALDNEKFLNIQREMEVRSRAAEKAALEAAKPKVLTLEEKAHARVVALVEKTQEKAAAKALAKALTGYHKRVGNVPSIGSPHYDRLKAGESVDSVLGIASVETEKSALDAAVGVAEKSDADAIAVAAPSAVKAVDVASKIAESSKPKAEPMFKASLDQLAAATTPEEYASAKRLAEQGIDEQANVRVKELQTQLKAGTLSVEEATQQGLKMAGEVQAAKQRIKTAKIPENISKKALDSKRKAAEIADATRTAVKESVELLASDHESKLVAGLDRVDKANKALEAHPNLIKAIYKEFMKLGTGDVDVLAEMLETAKTKLPPETSDSLKAGYKSRPATPFTPMAEEVQATKQRIKEKLVRESALQTPTQVMTKFPELKKLAELANFGGVVKGTAKDLWSAAIVSKNWADRIAKKYAGQSNIFGPNSAREHIVKVFKEETHLNADMIDVIANQIIRKNQSIIIEHQILDKRTLIHELLHPIVEDELVGLLSERTISVEMYNSLAYASGTFPRSKEVIDWISKPPEFWTESFTRYFMGELVEGSKLVKTLEKILSDSKNPAIRKLLGTAFAAAFLASGSARKDK